MTKTLHYRPLHLHEIPAACHLAASVFCRAVFAEFEPAGAAEFLQYLTPNEMARRLHHEYFVLVAERQGKLFGMIEVRDCDHISLLFVDETQQRQGIGRQLIEMAIQECHKHKPALAEITVSATPNAVPAYTQLGFHATDSEQLSLGMRFTPMALPLRQQDCVNRAKS